MKGVLALLATTLRSNPGAIAARWPLLTALNPLISKNARFKPLILKLNRSAEVHASLDEICGYQIY